jgi:hypothetical protein
VEVDRRRKKGKNKHLLIMMNTIEMDI